MTRSQVVFNLEGARLRLMAAKAVQRDACERFDKHVAAYNVMVATRDVQTMLELFAEADDQPELTDITPTRDFVIGI